MAGAAVVLLPPDLDIGAPSLARGRPPLVFLLAWGLRWIRWIVQRLPPAVRVRGAELLAASALAVAEEEWGIEEGAGTVEEFAQSWHAAIRSGNLADLRGHEAGGWRTRRGPLERSRSRPRGDGGRAA